MREMLEQRKFNRRRILISLISYAPLAPLPFGGAAEAAGKLSKQTVQYQPSPKGGQACAGCNSYVAPSQCKLVAGEISPSGWCRLWTKKEG